MNHVSRESYAKAARGVLIACVVAMLLYAFSPRPATRFGTVKEPAARKPMPEFTMPAMSGANWTLSEQAGKVILVNFWATWCPPCRAETPALVNIANQYRARGFEVVGVTLDDDPPRVVPQFVSRYRVSYPILVPTAESPLAGAIESLPTSLLVDKQGRVARTYIGAVDEADLAADIERLLIE
jgi:thiol-disulfide isomerase/thioredoxin